jgi:hypothetical protein
VKLSAEYIDDELDNIEETNEQGTDSPEVIDTKESTRRRIEDLQAERELNKSLKEVYD